MGPNQGLRSVLNLAATLRYEDGARDSLGPIKSLPGDVGLAKCAELVTLQNHLGDFVIFHV
jgi:hypothetical protein